MATRSGVIMGTAVYMSPEQARGKTVDRRADIWAFGVLLWEMLTGQRLFYGETVSDTLAVVIREELDWNKLPSDTPPPIRDLLRRCLIRDLKRRLQAIGDAPIAIEEHLDNPAASSPAATASITATAPLWQRAFPWTVAAALAVALLLLWAPWRAEEAAEQTPMRVQMEISAETSFVNFEAVLSPDGKHLAYVAGIASARKIYLRAMNQLEAKPMPGTERASDLFFSPDGQWIGFFENAGFTLKKVSTSGGKPVTICDAPSLRGGTWGADDTIVFGLSTGGLLRVPAAGGAPEELTKLSPNEQAHGWPHFLPGGHALLFASTPRGSPFGEANIEVLDLGSGERKVLYRGGMAPSYLPTGHIAFYADGTLFAAPFDLDRLEISGTPVPVLENVAASQYTMMNSYTFSASGTLLHPPGGIWNSTLTPAGVDRKGNVSPLPIPAGDYAKPVLSPDGSQIALRRRDGQGMDIFVYDLARGTFSRLTFFEGFDDWPVWSPNGRYITFASTRSGENEQIYRKRADGSGDAEPLTTDLEKQAFPSAWSPDGKTLAYSAFENGHEDLWILLMHSKDQAGSPEPFLETPFNELDPTFSPDGRWLAYRSDESGRTEVYVTPFPGGDGKWQVSNQGGWFPAWARNTPELFYRNGRKMMVVSYSSTDDVFRAEPPQELFTVPTMDSSDSETYDVSPDGKRFLVLIPQEDSEGPTTGHAILVLNWFDEIMRLVPTKN